MSDRPKPAPARLFSRGPETSHVVLPGEELATLQPGVEVIENGAPGRSR